jgi:iron complex outermembrane recepter protein
MSARSSVSAVAVAASVGLCASLHAQPANQPETLPQIRVTGKRPVHVRHRRVARRPAAAARAVPAPTPAVAPATTQAGVPGVGNAPGQTVTTIPTVQFNETPAFEIGDMLQYSPGISIKQGNGPRDEGISIRGSNARNGFGIRNIVMEEDGFPVTQPDGLSRSDLIDPHAYSGFDVYRGPSSAMFGNYATGGAINFHTWTGAQIDGAWYGIEGGSFGYINNYVDVGRKVGPLEYSLFASDVRGDGFIANSVFDTQTVNFLGSYALTPNDLVTMKVINNVTRTELPIRLSLTQFEENPFQKGCVTAATAAPGCATVSLDANGFSAPTVANTAGQAGLGRHDRRTITGVRWDHDFDNATTWRTQFVFDDKDINQPTGSTSAIGDSPAYNVMSDLIHRYSLFGLGLTSSAGVFYNTERLSDFTYDVAPGGNATLGALSSFYNGGQQQNYGARAREEIKFNDAWTGVLGADIERTQISTADTIFSFPGGVPVPSTVFPVDTQYLNHAEEAGLLYRPTDAWQFRGRVATGYGTPNVSQLTVTPAGVAGNNTALKTQTNLGYDLGADYTPNNTTKISVTGFYEFFTNEQVTQSPGAGLQSYTFNAPASQHRGVEAAVDWQPGPGWRLTAAYTYIDEVYTDYLEQLSAGVFTATFNRDGNKIPGVSPNELLARAAYDQPTGPWTGLGGFVEYQFKDGYFIDNANLVKVPAFGVINLNTHYVIDLTHNDLKSATLFFEVKNVFNKTYVASANDITDSLNSATGAENPGSVLATTGTSSIYAGAPRTFVGGFKLAFR